jgi:hypothetical protein
MISAFWMPSVSVLGSLEQHIGDHNCSQVASGFISKVISENCCLLMARVNRCGGG